VRRVDPEEEERSRLMDTNDEHPFGPGDGDVGSTLPTYSSPSSRGKKIKKKVFIVRDGDDKRGGGGDVEMVERKDANVEAKTSDSQASAEKVWGLPLMFFKTNNPMRSSSKKVQSPLHLRLPNNQVGLGMPVRKRGEVEGDDDDDGNERLMVFSSPGLAQNTRSNVFGCLLLFFLLPADLILATVIFIHSYLGGALFEDSLDTLLQNPDDVAATKVTHILTFVCTVFTLLLGIIGMRLKDTRIITCFIVVFYIDALVNLVKVYTVLQFSHFVVQLAVCHVMGQYKLTLVPSWFFPTT